jgi:D-arabinose 1-dehydrogenase-like Zn-dependent alcohol dehydrogenase
MMLSPSKSKSLAKVIVADMKDKKPDFVQKLGEPSTVKENLSGDDVETDDSVALDSAADSLISAIGSKDTKSVVSALKDFMDLCQSSDYSEDEE